MSGGNQTTIVPREPTDRMLWRAFLATDWDISFEEFMALHSEYRSDMTVAWKAMVEEANSSDR